MLKKKVKMKLKSKAMNLRRMEEKPCLPPKMKASH